MRPRLLSIALPCLFLASLSGCRRSRVEGVAIAASASEAPSLLPSSSAPAPSVSASAPIAKPKSPVFDIVADLSEQVGPRMSCSPGDAAAVAWAEAKMRTLGLSNVRAEKVDVPCWVRGAASATIAGESAVTLQIAALGGSVGTGGAPIDAEVVEVESLAAMEKLSPTALTGKIAFVNVKTERLADGSGYGKSVGTRWRGASVASKHGAVAFLLRSISTVDDDAPHTGGMGYADDVKKIPAAALGPKSADSLHASLAKGPTRIKLSIEADTKPDAPSANVVGEVPGSANPPEIVVIGAHLDSWDLGRGAQDDGAGVAIVLEAAHRIASDPQHRRTIRVVLYANEELGGRGAKGYVAAHSKELGRHVAAIEADEGAGRVVGLRFMGDPADDALIARLARPLEALGVAKPAHGEHAGADISAMGPHGVPLIDLSQDASGYFDVHHARTDVPASIDPAALEQAASVWLTFLRALADDATPLRRYSPRAHH